MATVTPPFFRALVPESAAAWISIGFRQPSAREASITLLEREMLQAWRSLSEQHGPESIFDLEQIHTEADRIAGKSRSPVPFGNKLRHRLKLLAHAGIVLRERAVEFGNPRAQVFSLRSPEAAAEAWMGDGSESQDQLVKSTKPLSSEMQRTIESTHRHLVGQGYLAVSLSPDSPLEGEPWTLQLISQLIERCSRSNSRERTDTLSTTIRLGGEPVKVDVGRVQHVWETGYEYGLITADDAQLLLVIITLAMRRISDDLSANRDPVNRHHIDLMELSRLLSPSDPRGAYRSFQKGMARLLNTEFALSPVSPDSPLVRQRFRLFENIAEGESEADAVRRTAGETTNGGMRYFNLSLNQHIWSSLLNGHTWMVHEDLLYERQGIIHKLYHHLRAHAGRCSTYTVNASDLMSRLNMKLSENPRRARIVFCKSLWQTLVTRARREQLMLGAKVPERISLRLYDIDLLIYPNDTHKEAFTVEARLSNETLSMIQRQQVRLREIKRLQNHSDSPRIPRLR